MDEFRVNFDKDGNVFCVERKDSDEWITVWPKQFPIKGEITDLKMIGVAIGPSDPCVIVGNNIYCW